MRFVSLKMHLNPTDSTFFPAIATWSAPLPFSIGSIAWPLTNGLMNDISQPCSIRCPSPKVLRDLKNDKSTSFPPSYIAKYTLHKAISHWINSLKSRWRNLLIEFNVPSRDAAQLSQQITTWGDIWRNCTLEIPRPNARRRAAHGRCIGLGNTGWGPTCEWNTYRSPVVSSHFFAFIFYGSS
jgi:hypothetical protein